MRYRSILVFTIFLLGLSMFIRPAKIFAGYTCCVNGNDPSTCNACDESGKEWKNNGNYCAPNSNCQACPGSHPVANACGSGGGGGGDLSCTAEFQQDGAKITRVNLAEIGASASFSVRARNLKGTVRRLTLTPSFGSSVTPNAFGKTQANWSSQVASTFPGESTVTARVYMDGSDDAICTAKLVVVTGGGVCQATCQEPSECNSHEVTLLNKKVGNRSEFRFDFVREYGIERQSNDRTGLITEGAFLYAGGWTAGTRFMDTTTEGATAKFRTNASTIQIGTVKGPLGGAVDIFVDGTLVQTLDLYSATGQVYDHTLSLSPQTNTSRTVRFVTDDPAGGRFIVDSLSDAGGVIDNTSPRLSFAPTQSGVQWVVQGAAHRLLATPNVGGSVSLTTTSPYVRIRAVANRYSVRNVRVLVDGQHIATLDLYQSLATDSYREYTFNVDKAANPFVCYKQSPSDSAGQCRTVSGGACPVPTTSSPTPGTPTPTPTPLPADIIGSVELDPAFSGGLPPKESGLSDRYCMSPDAGTPVGGGSVRAIHAITGAPYQASVNASGQFVIEDVPGAANAYTVTYQPPAGYICLCPIGCVYTNKGAPPSQPLQFYLTRAGMAWYQTAAGDVGAQNTSGWSIFDPIPGVCTAPSCQPYLMRPYAGLPESNGALLTAGGAVDLSEIDGNQQTNIAPDTIERWAQLATPLSCRENFEYFARLYSMGDSPTPDFTTPELVELPLAAPSSGREAYYYQGAQDLHITAPLTVAAGQSFVFFVQGNLQIEEPVTVQEGGFIAFIVSGSITVAPHVGTEELDSESSGQLQGIYIANGSIAFPKVESGTEKKLVAEGTFAGCSGIQIQRDLRTGGTGAENRNPAVLFLYRPDFVLNTPTRMRTTRPIWSEVAP